MALDREDILRRLVTGAEYLERNDLTPVQRKKAEDRYDELETELDRLKEDERTRVVAVPEEVAKHMQNIRNILNQKK